MNTIELITEYVDKLTYVWDFNLVQRLVLNKWKRLKSSGIFQENYNLGSMLLGINHKENLDLISREIDIYIEGFSEDLLPFYNQYGLVIKHQKTGNSEIKEKIIRAFSLLNLEPTCFLSVKNLIQTITILEKDFEYLDISYSHPEVPFSVFVSVCEDHSMISSLRVAESILHEAMHLKLSLIEQEVSIVENSSLNVYYSPWREEKRPAQGVLHGLYVFRAVYDFYEFIIKSLKDTHKVADYIENRQNEIATELRSLDYLVSIPELSVIGKALTSKLLQF